MRSVVFAIAAVLVLMGAATFVMAESDESVGDSASGSGTASSTGWTEASGTCGTEGASWSLKESDGILTISGTGKVSSISSTGTSAWTVSSNPGDTKPSMDEVRSSIKSIVIGTSGTVEKKAFNSLTKDFTVSFTTGHKTIEEGLFEGCTKLTNADLSNVTSVGKAAFKGCTALTAVTKLSSVTTVSESAFEGCTKLAAIGSSTGTLDEFGAVAIGKSAFKGCTALTQFDIGKASSIDRTAFEGCTKLAKFVSAVGAGTFVAVDDLIYSDSKKTLFMCPVAKTGTITKIESTVTKINLDYADVDYVLNATDLGNRTLTFDSSLTGAKATAVVYYTQSISDSPTAKIEGTTFSMTFKLCRGWSVDSTTVRIDGGSVTSADSTSLKMTVAPGKGYSVYPVGKSIVTESDLKGGTINSWAVKDVVLKCSKSTSGAVTDIEEYSCRITGYSGSGSAVLEKQLKNHGALCKVIGMAAGNYSGLTGLTVKGDMELSDGLFANCFNLRSVSMADATMIGPAMFRYCTSLESVVASSCTEIGAYAFEGCSKLSSVGLGAASVKISDGAFSNCGSLDMLKVGTNAQIEGDPGIFVVHSDDNATFRMYGDKLVITASGKSVQYSGTHGGAERSADLYRGGMTSVFVGGMDCIYVSVTSGTSSSKCLVVLDSGMGSDVKDLIVDQNGKLSDLKDISESGYAFKGWYDSSSGKKVTSEDAVSGSMVLIAEWERDVSEDRTPIVLASLFGMAVAASAVVLFVNSRR